MKVQLQKIEIVPCEDGARTLKVWGLIDGQPRQVYIDVPVQVTDKKVIDSLTKDISVWKDGTRASVLKATLTHT